MHSSGAGSRPKCRTMDGPNWAGQCCGKLESFHVPATASLGMVWMLWPGQGQARLVDPSGTWTFIFCLFLLFCLLKNDLAQNNYSCVLLTQLEK